MADAESTDASAPAVIPSHGNGALRPWQPGQSGNPGGRSPAMLEALRLAREATPEAMRTLLAIMRDECAGHGLDRGLGKVKEGQPPDSGRKLLDLSHLSAEQRAELAAAMG